MVLEITPPLEDRLRKLAAHLHLDQNGVQNWLLTVLDKAVPPDGPVTEEELLRKMNEGFPAEWWDRYRELVAQREAGTLLESDLGDLIAMTDAAEERHAARLEALADLAERRGIEPAVLMRQMGLKPEFVTAA